MNPIKKTTINMILLLFILNGCGGGNSSSYTSNTLNEINDTYPIHNNITSTYFYIGETSSRNNDYITNTESAWDNNWSIHFGGIDSPTDRNISYPYYPFSFIPKENPFYVALPFDDFENNGSKKPNLSNIIPWYIPTFQSLMKNRWIKITHNNKTAYAQIEDAGPAVYNDYQYVFGNATPSNTFRQKAGIDVSPAIKIYLGLNDVDTISWQFINSNDVPNGPWKNIITTRGVTWLSKNWPTFDTNTTWQWQLDGTINTDYNVDVYDIDIDTPQDTINTLHSQGKKVICYFSAGSIEYFRDDANDFPKDVIGKKMDGWDENWLDIRSDIVKKIMEKRFDLAKSKKCDAIEADNVDGWNNDTGFNITYQDQLKYNIFLAYEAHKRGMGIGLKNDVDQINDLEMYFDFAINESCFDYDECNLLKPFISENKPVFSAEYKLSNKEEICKKAKELHFQTLFLPINLDDSFREACE